MAENKSSRPVARPERQQGTSLTEGWHAVGMANDMIKAAGVGVTWLFGAAMSGRASRARIDLVNRRSRRIGSDGKR